MILDEISYRAIAIGYPDIHAWRIDLRDDLGLDCLVTILGLGSQRGMGTYYLALLYGVLHFRLSRGWHGKKSAWLAVIGFVVVLFTLVGVNLIPCRSAFLCWC